METETTLTNRPLGVVGLTVELMIAPIAGGGVPAASVMVAVVAGSPDTAFTTPGLITRVDVGTWISPMKYPERSTMTWLFPVKL